MAQDERARMQNLIMTRALRKMTLKMEHAAFLHVHSVAMAHVQQQLKIGEAAELWFSMSISTAFKTWHQCAVDSSGRMVRVQLALQQIGYLQIGAVMTK